MGDRNGTSRLSSLQRSKINATTDAARWRSGIFGGGALGRHRNRRGSPRLCPVPLSPGTEPRDGGRPRPVDGSTGNTEVGADVAEVGQEDGGDRVCAVGFNTLKVTGLSTELKPTAALFGSGSARETVRGDHA